MKDFLLEHYRIVNERLTQSDRNRDVWVGAYLTLVVGSLAFFFSLDSSDKVLWLKFFILVFLFSCGVIVAIYVTIARGWHCEFTRAAMAISIAFLDEELNLMKAARKFKRSREFGHYFNIVGTEFCVFVFVLLCLSFELFLLSQMMELYFIMAIPVKVLFCALPFLIGILLYWCHLKKRENKFPKQCYYSIPRKPRAS